MQDETADNVVGKRPVEVVGHLEREVVFVGCAGHLPLRRDGRELSLVGLGGLDSEGSWQETNLAIALVSGRRLHSNVPVRTNWPTVAQNPERKALKG